MREFLQNIGKAGGEAVRYGRVQRRLSPSRLELVDDAGRLFQAEHGLGLHYATGTRLAVQSGRVVAAAAAAENVKTYEV